MVFGRCFFIVNCFGEITAFSARPHKSRELDGLLDYSVTILPFMNFSATSHEANMRTKFCLFGIAVVLFIHGLVFADCTTAYNTVALEHKVESQLAQKHFKVTEAKSVEDYEAFVTRKGDECLVFYNKNNLHFITNIDRARHHELNMKGLLKVYRELSREQTESEFLQSLKTPRLVVDSSFFDTKGNPVFDLDGLKNLCLARDGMPEQPISYLDGRGYYSMVESSLYFKVLPGFSKLFFDILKNSRLVKKRVCFVSFSKNSEVIKKIGESKATQEVQDTNDIESESDFLEFIANHPNMIVIVLSHTKGGDLYATNRSGEGFLISPTKAKEVAQKNKCTLICLACSSAKVEGVTIGIDEKFHNLTAIEAIDEALNKDNVFEFLLSMSKKDMRLYVSDALLDKNVLEMSGSGGNGGGDGNSGDGSNIEPRSKMEKNIPGLAFLFVLLMEKEAGGEEKKNDCGSK